MPRKLFSWWGLLPLNQLVSKSHYKTEAVPRANSMAYSDNTDINFMLLRKRNRRMNLSMLSRNVEFEATEKLYEWKNTRRSLTVLHYYHDIHLFCYLRNRICLVYIIFFSLIIKHDNKYLKMRNTKEEKITDLAQRLRTLTTENLII